VAGWARRHEDRTQLRGNAERLGRQGLSHRARPGVWHSRSASCCRRSRANPPMVPRGRRRDCPRQQRAQGRRAPESGLLALCRWGLCHRAQGPSGPKIRRGRAGRPSSRSGGGAAPGFCIGRGGRSDCRHGVMPWPASDDAKRQGFPEYGSFSAESPGRNVRSNLRRIPPLRDAFRRICELNHRGPALSQAPDRSRSPEQADLHPCTAWALFIRSAENDPGDRRGTATSRDRRLAVVVFRRPNGRRVECNSTIPGAALNAPYEQSSRRQKPACSRSRRQTASGSGQRLHRRRYAAVFSASIAAVSSTAASSPARTVPGRLGHRDRACTTRGTRLRPPLVKGRQRHAFLFGDLLRGHVLRRLQLGDHCLSALFGTTPHYRLLSPQGAYEE
jgi:hypothetical protein